MTKKLYRSKKDSIIAGVCGGIAEYFQLDSTLVRLLAILVVFLGGAGVIAYIVAWIIIPQNPEQETEPVELNDAPSEDSQVDKDSKRHIWGGFVLIALGLFFLARSFFPRLMVVSLWPIILIAVGIFLIIQSLPRKK
ncbi:MAG TPA: PspC domain-containing protein [Atribacterota bacterium]|nr:PspC domain-containing protein [Atribacterota bacterium]HPK87299.1 PspC domain-containing protein [Atribacterota bacterium]